MSSAIATENFAPFDNRISDEDLQIGEVKPSTCVPVSSTHCCAYIRPINLVICRGLAGYPVEISSGDLRVDAFSA